MWKGMSVSLSEADDGYIRGLVKENVYTGISDAVRAAIRTLQKERGDIKRNKEAT